jgi:nitrite reductase/ring-hydroxylating ferredoxin subunit
MAEFVTIAQTTEIAEGEMVQVELGDSIIAVANVDGAFHAFDAECPHAGGPLDEGELEGETVVCPWHGGEFDVKTGEVLAPPPMEALTTFEVRVDGTNIQIAQ